jgi:3-oxoacyl-[acyl-carrier protein] reductase
VSSVVLTGASRGIGRATALALAERGSELVLLGRSSAALRQTAELAGRKGAAARVIPCDLLVPDDIEAAAERVLGDVGAPDALINNAGIIHRASVEALSLAEWDEQLSINLRAPFVLTRALLPAMRAAGKGRIVHVSSISATLGSPNASAYAASKWGLVGFMKSLAEELHDSGLMTVAVLPGSVDTAMLRGSGFSPRMTPEDVAGTLVHYALDASLAHNGGIIEMFGT